MIKIKLLTAALLLVTGSIFASNTELPPCVDPPTPITRNTIGYVSLGLGPCPAPIPNFSVGFRKQKDRHGMDLSLSAASIIQITEVKASALYLHYFKPHLPSQFYIGCGAGVGGLFFKEKDTFFKSPCPFISPEFAFGKQYLTDTNALRFFQMQLSFPTFGSHYTLYFPLVILSYGIAF